MDGLLYFAENAKTAGWTTVNLMADIDLAGKTWTPIDLWSPENAAVITIDGNSKKISNMTINGTYNQGFIGSVANCTLTIKDLTFENAKLTDVNNFSGVVIGYQYGDVTLNNVDVVNAQINTKEIDKGNNEYDRGIRVGGLVGFSPMNVNCVKMTLSNCDLSCTKIYAWHIVGGLVGTMQNFMINTSKWNVTNCTVTNCELTLLTPTAKSTYANAFAASGEYSRTVPAYNKVFTDKGNTATDVTVKIRDGFAYVANGDQSHYEISTPNGLKYFRDSVNGGTSYAGETVNLMNDITLSGEWTPIGTNADGANKFMGTFDGGNHTISGLVVNTDGYLAAGFFGALNGTLQNLVIDGAQITGMSHTGSTGATSNGIAVAAGSIYNTGLINNVTVKNSTVNGNRYVAGIAGYVYGSITNCVVENCTITAAADNLAATEEKPEAWDNGDKVGGIAGYFPQDSNNTLENNTVKGTDDEQTVITGYRDVGGIVGCATGPVKGSKVDNVQLNRDMTHDYKSSEYSGNDAYDFGKIIGDGTVDPDANNTATNVTIDYNYTPSSAT